MNASTNALAAKDKEWAKLRSQRVWDESVVKSWDTVMWEAVEAGKYINIGKYSESALKKASELQDDDEQIGETGPKRKLNGAAAGATTNPQTDRKTKMRMHTNTERAHKALREARLTRGMILDSHMQSEPNRIQKIALARVKS